MVYLLQEIKQEHLEIDLKSIETLEKSSTEQYIFFFFFCMHGCGRQYADIIKDIFNESSWVSFDANLTEQQVFIANIKIFQFINTYNT